MEDAKRPVFGAEAERGWASRSPGIRACICWQRKASTERQPKASEPDWMRQQMSSSRLVLLDHSVVEQPLSLAESWRTCQETKSCRALQIPPGQDQLTAMELLRGNCRFQKQVSCLDPCLKSADHAMQGMWLILASTSSWNQSYLGWPGTLWQKKVLTRTNPCMSFAWTSCSHELSCFHDTLWNWITAATQVCSASRANQTPLVLGDARSSNATSSRDEG